jgi:hypothetical protein
MVKDTDSSSMSEATHNNKESDDHKGRYSPAVVSYIDLLGMKQLLADAGEDASKVASVLNTFRRFSSPSEASRDIWEWSFVNFSDLIVRAVPILADANVKYRLGLIFHEVLDLCFLQVNLLDRNILIRGALTIGDIYVQDGLIFGPALVQGYQLESKRAIFPRIIVDPLVLDALKERPELRAHDTFEEEMSYLERTLRTDEDGELFLDYLAWLLDNADDNEQCMAFFAKHKRFVDHNQNNLRAQDLGLNAKEREHRQAKIDWLRKLHNFHVKKLKADVVQQEAGVSRDSLLVEENPT